MTPLIDIRHLRTQFGEMIIHRDINLTVYRGEILGIVGGSGCGKTSLLRAMLALTTSPPMGTIHLFNHNLFQTTLTERLAIQRRCGVLFQQNALFSSLNLLENVAFPLHEHYAHLDTHTIQQLALLKILMTGLSADTALKYPVELSGGMLRRAGLSRAIALDPELLFLDEPTAGLDPCTAAGFDELILRLRQCMNLTVVIVTHDLDTLWAITDRIAFLGEGVVLATDHILPLSANTHPAIQAFFQGPRGRQALQQHHGDHGHKH